MYIYPNPAPKGLRDTSNGNMSPQLLAEYIQYQYINSTDRYSSIFGNMSNTNKPIIQGPNLPQPNIFGAQTAGA